MSLFVVPNISLFDRANFQRVTYDPSSILHHDVRTKEERQANKKTVRLDCALATRTRGPTGRCGADQHLPNVQYRPVHHVLQAANQRNRLGIDEN